MSMSMYGSLCRQGAADPEHVQTGEGYEKELMDQEINIVNDMERGGVL
jgi:hypothetical protein